jgi:hypothetical protein
LPIAKSNGSRAVPREDLSLDRWLSISSITMFRLELAKDARALFRKPLTKEFVTKVPEATEAESWRARAHEREGSVQVELQE